jgi:hypothetical protein
LRSCNGRIVRAGVGAGVDRRRTAGEQLLGERVVAELAVAQQLRRRRLRLVVPDQRAQVGIVLRQRIAGAFEVVDEQRLLHRVARADGRQRQLALGGIARGDVEQGECTQQQRQAAGGLQVQRFLERLLLLRHARQLVEDHHLGAAAGGFGPLAERILGGPLLRLERRIEQRAVLAAVQLLAVLEAQDRRAQPLLERRIAGGGPAEHVEAMVDQRAHARIARLALVLELRLRQQALRAAGIAGQEHQFAVLRPVAPDEVRVARVRRLAVDVGAAEREVERVARVDEVVGVAAEVRDLQMRRHHQAHVVEHAVLVELPDAALEQLDQLRLEPRLRRTRVGEQTLAIRLALLLGGLGVHRRQHPHQHVGGDVAHRHQLLHGQARQLHLLGEFGGDEAVAHPVALPLHLRHRVARAVVVGQDQALRRHERRRAAAAEAQRREAHAVPPRLVGAHAVLAFEVGERRPFERPHLAQAQFVLRQRRGGGDQQHSEGAQQTQRAHHLPSLRHFAINSRSRSAGSPVRPNGLSPRSVFAQCSVSRTVSAIGRKRRPAAIAFLQSTTLRPSRGIHSGICM